MVNGKKVIVIGAGLAGLSLATELADQGFEVTVLEKNPYLGGRASNTIDKKTGHAVPIGPHVFTSSYKNLLAFLKKIGAHESIYWDPNVLIDFYYQHRHIVFKVNKHLGKFQTFPWFLQYSLVSWPDRLTNMILAREVFFSSPDKFEKLDGMNAYDYLKKLGVAESFINKFFRFLILSLLNVPLEQCSAAECMLLLKQWNQLGPFMFGFSTVGLGDLYVHNAEQFLKERNGKILTNTTVKKIESAHNAITHLEVEHNGDTQNMTADIYVSTATPVDLRGMLPKHTRESSFFSHLEPFEGVPYISVNLWFDKKISHKKFWALLSTAEHPTLNTDFYDQSNIYQPNLEHSFITSNIIYSKPHESMTDEEIVNKTFEEIKQVFPDTDAHIVHSVVNRIPYVIYGAFPGMRKHKRSHITPIQNFYLAGDWIGRGTQCMEAAVKSGYECAERILLKEGIHKQIHLKSIL